MPSIQAPPAKSAGVSEADVGDGAALDTVIAGELVDIEQVGRVEHEALRVVVRQRTDADFVRPHDELRDRRDRLRGAAAGHQQRQAPLDAAAGMKRKAVDDGVRPSVVAIAVCPSDEEGVAAQGQNGVMTWPNGPMNLALPRNLFRRPNRRAGGAMKVRVTHTMNGSSSARVSDVRLDVNETSPPSTGSSAMRW